MGDFINKIKLTIVIWVLQMSNIIFTLCKISNNICMVIKNVKTLSCKTCLSCYAIKSFPSYNNHLLILLISILNI